MTRGDDDGELADIAGEGRVVAEVLADGGHALGQQRVMHESGEGAADPAALGRDAVVDLLGLGLEGAQNVWQAGHD